MASGNSRRDKDGSDSTIPPRRDYSNHSKQSRLRNVTNADSLPVINEEDGSDSNEQKQSLNEEDPEESFRNTWGNFLDEAKETEMTLKGVIDQLGELKTDLENENKKLKSVPIAVSSEAMSKPQVIKRLHKIFQGRREKAKVTLANLKPFVEGTRRDQKDTGDQVTEALKGLRN